MRVVVIAVVVGIASSCAGVNLNHNTGCRENEKPSILSCRPLLQERRRIKADHHDEAGLPALDSVGSKLINPTLKTWS